MNINLIDAEINLIDAAYLAGIIDGEGCVSLARRKVKYITPTIQVTNTDRRLIEWLLQFGGSVNDMREVRPNRRASWMWRTAGKQTRDILAVIRPYLRLKGEQADIALGITRVTEWRRDSLGRLRETLTAKQHETNAAALAEIRALNRRGPRQ